MLKSIQLGRKGEAVGTDVDPCKFANRDITAWRFPPPF